MQLMCSRIETIHTHRPTELCALHIQKTQHLSGDAPSDSHVWTCGVHTLEAHKHSCTSAPHSAPSQMRSPILRVSRFNNIGSVHQWRNPADVDDGKGGRNDTKWTAAATYQCNSSHESRKPVNLQFMSNVYPITTTHFGSDISCVNSVR